MKHETNSNSLPKTTAPYEAVNASINTTMFDEYCIPNTISIDRVTQVPNQNPLGGMPQDDTNSSKEGRGQEEGNEGEGSEGEGNESGDYESGETEGGDNEGKPARGATPKDKSSEPQDNPNEPQSETLEESKEKHDEVSGMGSSKGDGPKNIGNIVEDDREIKEYLVDKIIGHKGTADDVRRYSVR